MHQYPSDHAGEPRSDDVVEVLEEGLSVEKRQKVTGRVRVHLTTETVEELVKETLHGEAVEISRVPVDRVITEVPAVRTEGDVTVVPVVEEILVVEKRLRLKEELHIRRRKTTEAVETPVVLKQQHAAVERLSPEEK